MELFLLGNPCFCSFFNRSGQIALFSTEPLDGLEPKLLFQLVRELHAYSTHFQSPIFYQSFCARFDVSDVFPISELPDAKVSHLFLSSVIDHLKLAYLHITLYVYSLIRVLVYCSLCLVDKQLQKNETTILATLHY